jgi:hypothetical protein
LGPKHFISVAPLAILSLQHCHFELPQIKPDPDPSKPVATARLINPGV